MADPTVKLVFTGNSADAERAIASLERKYTALEEKLKRTNQAVKGMGTGPNPLKQMEESALGLARNLVPVIGLGTALAKTFQDAEERSAKAFAAMKKAAPPMETLAVNLPVDVTLQTAKERIAAIAKETGADPDSLAGGLAQAFSAKGDLPSESAFQAVKKSAELLPNSPAMQEILAGSILDVRKLRPDVTEEESLGFLRKTMGMSRVVNFGQFAKNATPGVLGMAMHDKDIESNAAAYATLTQAANDFEGASSRTAGAALVTQIRDFYGKLGEGKTNEELMLRLSESAAERETFFKGGESLDDRKKKWAGASFERAFEKPMEELLTPGTGTFKMWRQFDQDIGTVKQAGDQFQGLKRQLKGDEMMREVDVGNRIEAGTKLLQQKDRVSAGWDTAFQKGTENLQAAGVPWPERYRFATGMWAERMTGLTTPEASMNRGLEWLYDRAQTNAAVGAMGTQPSQEWQDIAKNMRELVEISRQQLEESKKKPQMLPNRQGQREGAP